MSKKNKTGMPFNNLEVVTEAKYHFLSLCKMYEEMGKLFALQSKVISHPMFSTTTIPKIQERLLQQHAEIGEELKNIGSYLDLMPGKNVLKEKDDDPWDKSKVIHNHEEELGRTHEGEDPTRTFVSNIAPEDLEAEKNGYQTPEENQ